MKKSILLIISLFLAVTVSAQDVSSALRQAQARFESGNETGGIELVNKVLAKYPDNKEAKDLLAKFNQAIKDREIDADWKIAQTQNTFESYQQFRTKHPGSKYDDIASDTMAKKLADKFNANSTYADRTKAESYAKKSMTKDYIANKWKAAMAKKTSSTSSTTSSTSSYGSSNSSPRSYNSSSSTSSNRYGSSYGSSYSSSSSSSYESRSYNSYNTIPNKSKFAIGIEGAIDGLENSISTSCGLTMRIGAFNSLFTLTIGAKYQYSTTYDDYHYYSYWGGTDYEYHSAWHKHSASQFMIPLIVNWNVARTESFGYYLGVGYEHGFIISQKDQYKPTEDGFDYNEYVSHEDYQPSRYLSLPSRSVIVQTGFAGRHWDGKLYYKIYTNSNSNLAADPGAFGMAFTYYF